MSSASSSAPTLKQQAHALIDQLPDNATWEDLAYEISIILDIEAGLADSDANRVVDTATVRKHFGLSE